jgi:hypothetical protein
MHYISFGLTDQKTGAEIARRSDELDWMVDTLADSKDGMIGPLVLSQIPTTQGNPAWIFKAAK